MHEFRVTGLHTTTAKLQIRQLHRPRRRSPPSEVLHHYPHGVVFEWVPAGPKGDEGACFWFCESYNPGNCLASSG